MRMARRLGIVTAVALALTAVLALTVLHVSAAPNVTVTKTSSAAGTAHPGDSIVYTVRITNSGTSDATVTVTDTLPAQVSYVPGTARIATPLTFADNFDAVSWGNDDGTGTWSTNWLETNDLVGPHIGDIVVGNESGRMAMRLRKPSKSVEREADTRSMQRPTLRIERMFGNLQASATFYLDVSSNGGLSWTSAVRTWTFGIPSETWETETIDLTPYRAANTAIRFRTGGTVNWNNMYLDTVLIYDAGAALSAPPTLITGLLLPPSSVEVISLTVQARQPTSGGNTMINRARVFGPGVDVTASVSDLLIAPILAITKTATAAVDAGQIITYTVRVTNTGNATANNVSVYDPVPQFTTFEGMIASVPEGVALAARVPVAVALDDNNTSPLRQSAADRWLAGGFSAAATPPWVLTGQTLGPAGFVTVSWKVRTTVPLTNNLAIHNTASVTCTQIITPVYASADTTVHSAPALAMSKSATDLNGSLLNPGDVISYTVRITNTGNGNATGVAISDTLPANTTWVGGVAVSPPSAGGVPGTPPLVLAGSSVPGAGGVVTVKYSVQVNTPLDTGTIITNTASVEADGVSPIVSTVTNTVTSSAAVTLTKSSQDVNGAPLRPGDILSYTVVLTNSGTMNADDVVGQHEFRDDLPLSHASYVSGSAVASNGAIAYSSGHINWDGDLLVGQPVTLKFSIQLDPVINNGTQITNSAEARVDSDGDGDLDGADFQATSNTTVDVVTSSPTISVTKVGVDADGGPPLRPGDRIQYTVTFTNTGDMNATGMVITDTMPAHTSLSFRGPAPDAGTWDLSVSDVRITGVSLPVGGSASFFFNATLDPVIESGTVIPNRAYVGYNNGGANDRLAVSNETQHAVTSAPALGVSKQASPGGKVPGQSFVYTVTLTNSGDAPATGVVVSDTLPSQMAFADSVTISPPAAGGTPGVSAPTIASGIRVDVGATVTVTFAVTLTSPLTNGLVIGNVAAADCAQVPAWVLSPVANITVSSAPLMTGNKTAVDLNGGALVPGDRIRYTIVMTNSGTMNQPDDPTSELVDVIPVNTTFVPSSLSASSGTPLYEGPSTSVLWDGPISVGQPVTVTFDVDLLPVLPNGTFISNSARVRWDSNGDNVLDTTTFANTTSGPVVSAPALLIHKTMTDLDGGLFEPGDEIRFSVRITNAGNMDIADLPAFNEFVDPLATGLLYKDGSTSGPYGSFAATTYTEVRWTGAISVGQPITLAFSALVQFPPTIYHGTVISNTGRVEFDRDGDGSFDTIAYSNTVSDTVFYMANVHAVKTAQDVNGPPLQPSEALRYWITMTNTGNMTATVALTDSVPANTTWGDSVVAPPGAVNNSSPAGLDVTNIAVPPNGGSATVRFRVFTDLPLPNGTQISNQGYITYNSTGIGPFVQSVSDDPSTPASDDPTVVTVTSAPVITVTKTSTDMSPGALRPGDVLSYTVVITNSGNENAVVNIYDAVPASTQWDDSVTITPPAAGGTIGAPPNVVTGMTVVAGTSVTATYAVRLDFPLNSGSLIVNTAQVSGTGFPTVSGTVTNTMISWPVCTVTKFGTDINGGNVVPGDRLQYQFAMANTGDMNQAFVPDTAWDMMSSSVIYATGSVTATSGSAVYSPTLHAIVWSGGIAAGGQVTVTYEADVKVPLPNGSTIQNTVYLDWDSSGDGYNDTTSTANKTFTVTSAPLVVATKSSQDMNGLPLRPGDVLSYTIVLNNVGTMNAAAVAGGSFDDQYPDEYVSYVSGSATASSGTIFPVPPDIVTWQGAITVGQPVTLTFAVQVTSPITNGTVISNSGTLFYDSNGDGVFNGSDVPAHSNTVTNTVVSAPEIVAFKRVLTALPIEPGDIIAYSVTFTNTGNMDALGVVLTDTIPAYTTFSAIGPLPGGGVNESTASEIKITGISVNAGQSLNLLFDVVVVSAVPVGTNITNTTYFAYDTDANGVNDTTAQSNQTSSPVTSAPMLAITKGSADVNGGVLIPGETLRFTVVLGNGGNAPAQNTVVSDPLPANTTWADNVHVDPPAAGGTPGSPPNVVTGVTVQVGETVTVTYDVIVTPGTEDQTHIVNSASVTALGAPVPVVSNSTDDVVYSPRLLISKFSSPAVVEPTQMLTYSIRVSNTGNATATNLRITDTLSPHVVYVPGSSRLGVPTTYGDDFETVGYSGSTGNTAWGAPWTEFGDDGSAATGSIIVGISDASEKLIIYGGGSYYIFRAADTSLFAAPRLEFDRRVIGLQVGSTFTLDVWNGSTWVNAYTWSGPLNEGSSSHQTVDLTPYKHANMSIAFRGNAAVPSEILTVDNVLITDAAGALSAPPGVASGLTLPAGQAVWVTLNASATTPLTDGMSIVNQASTGCSEMPGPVTVTASSVVSSTVALSATKAVLDLNGDFIAPYDTVRYTITITATGSGVATGTNVYDPLPADTTWVGNVTITPPSYGGTPGVAPNVVTGLNLPAGATVVVTFDVRVDRPLADGTVIHNEATINSPDVPVPVLASLDTTVHTPILTLVKEASPSPVEAGGLITYTVFVTNSGVAAATGVYVTDTLPVSVTAIPGSGWVKTTRTYADDFDIGNYSGSTGNYPWPGPWTETSDDGSSVTGYVHLGSYESSIRLRIAGAASPVHPGIYREADITGMLRPRVAFDRKLADLLAGDQFKLYVRVNGAWVAVLSWTGPMNDSGWTREYVDLFPYMASDFAIKFESSQSVSSIAYLYVDNLVIYDGGLPAGVPPLLVSGLTLKGGHAFAISFLGLVAKPLENNATFVNRAGVSSVQAPDPITTELITAVMSRPNVLVSKTSFDPSGPPVRPGHILNYRVVLSNTGNMNQHDNLGHELTDSIPSSTTYIPGSLVATGGAAAYNGGLNRIEWNGGLNINAVVTISFSVQLPSIMDNGTVISNTAALSYDHDGDNSNTPGLRWSTVTDIVSSLPVISGTKTAVDVNGGVLRPGEVISYTVTFTNVGTMNQSDKAGPEFIDPIPANAAYVTGTLYSTPGAPATFNAGLNRIEWSGPLTVGVPVTVKFAVQANSPLANGTVISNTAQVLYDANGDGASNESTYNIGPTSLTISSGAVIALTKNALDVNGGSLEPGDRLQYTIGITNTGDMDIVGMVFTDTVPVNTSFVSVTDLPPGAVLVTTVPQVRITGLTALVGASISFRINVDVNLPLTNGTSISNQGFVAYDSTLRPTDDPTTPAVGDPTVRTVTSGPILSVIKTAPAIDPGTFGANDLLQYQVVISNGGNANATSVVVSDTLPANTTWQDAVSIAPPSAGGAAGSPPSIATGITVVARQTVTVTFNVRINVSIAEGTPITNTVAVRCAEDATWRTSTLILTAHAPILGVAKTSTPNPVEAGEPISYTVWITNSGGHPATNVSVSDALPPGVTYAPGSAMLAVTRTYADDFETNNYAGSTGTAAWAGPWLENPSDGGPLAGDITVLMEDGSRRLHVSGTDRYVYREADTSMFMKPTLTLARKLGGLTVLNQYFALDVWNGSSWNEVHLWVGPASESSYTVETYDLTPWQHRNMAIRFRAGPDNSASQHLYVDDVRIYDAGVPGGAPPALATGVTVGGHTTLKITFVATVNSPMLSGTTLLNAASVTSFEHPTPIVVTAANNVHSIPVLVVAKTSADVNGASLIPSDVLRYQVIIQNAGNADATSVSVSDAVPLYTTWVGNVSIHPPSAGGSTGAAPNIATGMTVMGGETITVTFEVRVDLPVPDGTIVENVAYVSSLQLPGPFVATITNTVHAPTLLISKTATPEPVEAGDLVTYNILVTNTGSLAASNLGLSDTLPAHVAYQAGSSYWALTDTYLDTFAVTSYSENYGTVEWAGPWAEQNDDGSALGGDVQIVWDAGSMRLRVRSSNRSISREADISCFPAPVLRFDRKIQQLEAGKAVYLDVFNGSSWTVVQSWFGPIDEATYNAVTVNLTAYKSSSFRVRFRSGSTTDAGDALFVDDVQIFDAGQAGGAPPTLISGFNLPAGSGLSAQFVARVDSPMPRGWELQNTARVMSTEWPQGFSASASSTVHSTTTIDASKTSEDVDGGTLIPGDLIQYTIVLVNTGNQNQPDNEGDELVDPIPSGTTFAGLVSASSGVAEYDSGSDRIVWNGELLVGEPVTIAFTVQVNESVTNGTDLVNRATVYYDADGDGTSESSTQTNETRDTLVSAIIVEAIKTSEDLNGGDLVPGDLLRYTIVMVNTGDQDQPDREGNEMIDPIPAGTVLEGPVAASSGLAEFNAGDNQVVWNGALNVDQPVTVTFTVRVNNGVANGTSVHNQAAVSVDADGDGEKESVIYSNTTDDIVTSSVDVEATKISLDLNGGLLVPGNVIQYTVIVTNSGNMDMPDTPGVHEFADVIPENTSYQAGSAWASSGTPDYDEGAVIWDGAIPAGGTVTIRFNVIVQQDTPNHTSICNQGLVYYDQNGDGEVNQEDAPGLTSDPRVPGEGIPTCDEVRYAPSVEATKLLLDLNGGSLVPGDQLRYTIVVRNVGNAPMINARYVDDVPVHTTFVVGSETADSGSIGIYNLGHTVRWDGSLDPGSAVVISFVVRVGSPLPNGTQICNQGTLYYDANGDFVNEASQLTDDPRTPQPGDATCDAVVSGPALSVRKLSEDTDGGQLLPRDYLRYSVVISNTGTDAATSVSVRDTLSPRTTFMDAVTITPPAAGGVTGAPPTIASGITIPAGGAVTVTFLSRVDASLLNGTVITNTAVVSCPRIPLPETAVVTDTVTSSHTLALTKVASPKPVSAGGLLTYTIAHAVIGDEPSLTAVVADEVPANTQFVSASNGAFPLDGVIAWNLGDLPAGSAGNVSFVVRVDAPLPRGTLISNTASIADAQGRHASSTDTTTVTSDHELVLSKTALTPQTQGGDLLTYRLVLTATGNEPATGVVVSDATPPGTTFHSASGGLSQDKPPVGSIGTVRWMLGTVLPGELQVLMLTVRVNSDVPMDTVIVNWANVIDDQGKGSSANASTPVLSTDLALVKTVTPATVKSADVITYTLSYVNIGPARAQDVRITDTLPAGLTYGGTVFASPGVAGPSQVGSNLVWTISSLAPGATGQIVFTATVNPTGSTSATFTNLATISTVTAERGLANNTDSASNSLRQTIAVIVTKSSSAGGVAHPGGEITYTVRITNVGTGPAMGLAVSDPTPANMDFQPGSIVLSPLSAGTPGTTPPSLATGVTVPVGGAVTVQFRVRVRSPLADGTEIVNRVTVSGGALVALVEAQVTDVVRRPVVDVRVSKTSSGNGLALPGGELTYTIRVTNIGQAFLSGLTIYDPLPANTTFVANSITIDPAGAGTVGAAPPDLATNVSIPVGGSVVVRFRVLVQTPLANGTEIVNGASVSGGGLPEPVRAQVTDVVPSQFTAVRVAKFSSGNGLASPGQELTYTIRITNVGQGAASGLLVSDSVPANTDFVPGSVVISPAGAGTVGPPPIIASGITVPVGGSVAVSFRVRVRYPLDNGTVITNSATVSGGALPSPLQAQVTDTVPQQYTALRALKLSSTRGSVRPGQEITYSILITNVGVGAVSGISVSDAVPANTDFVPGSIAISPAGAGTPGTTPPGIASNITVPVGTAVTVQFRVRVRSPLPNGTRIVNRATVYGPTLAGADLREATAPIELVAEATDVVTSSHTLGLVKLDQPDPVQAGGLLTYTIQYQVMGDEAATGVAIVDTVPAHVSVVSVSTGGVVSGNQIGWSLGAMNPPASGTVRFTVRVDSPLASGTVLTDTAQISDDQGKFASAVSVTTVQSVPILAISKTAPVAVGAGELVTYTLRFTNTGNANATSVVITDRIPLSTTWKSGGQSHTATEVRWDVSVLGGNGGTGVVTFSVTVSPMAQAGQVIWNQYYGVRSTEAVVMVSGSPVGVSVSPPTGVTLSRFALSQQGAAVRAEWSTSLERDSLGFNLYRSTNDDLSGAMKLNADLIWSTAGGTGHGADYSFTDTSVEMGKTYFYWLEDVDVYGNVKLRVRRTITVGTAP